METSRVLAVVLSVVLGAAIHLDWHLARPHHHRLSLEWSYHWAVTAAIFGVVGWFVARSYSDLRWRVGLVVLFAGVFIGQVLEPGLEAAFYDGRLGYDVEPERWRAFWQTMVVAAPTYLAALWLRGRTSPDASAPLQPNG
jgi:hypothetical protein